MAERRKYTAADRYLVFDVGCIECGEPSAIVGRYRTPELAEAARAAAEKRQAANWKGQHWFHVYDLSTLKEV